MISPSTELVPTAKPQSGFTLIEMMIVVAVIGIISAIAYPNYQRFIIKAKRTDMMSEMHNIASQIKTQKLALGRFSAVDTNGLAGSYPKQGQALYTVSITPSPLTPQWQITATPIANTQMANDGTLTLNHLGIKCRASTCGSNDEWNK